MEVYRAIKAGNPETIEHEIKRISRFSEMIMRGPFMEEFGFGGKESHMFAMEFPGMLEHTLMRTLEIKKAHSRRKPQKSLEPGEPGN